MLNSGYSYLMFQVSIEASNSSVYSLCHVKAIFCLLPPTPFGIGVYKHIENNADELNIYWISLLVLSYVSVFLLSLHFSYLVFLIHTSLLCNV